MTNTENTLTEKLTCTLEVISPLHVGAGEVWKRNLDYFIDEGEIFVVDQARLFEELLQIPAGEGQTAIELYTRFLGNERDHVKIEQLIRREDIPLVDVAAQRFSYPDAGEPAREIRPLIRNGFGNSYIPGSSIKGAIRNALLNYLFHRLQLSPKDFLSKQKISSRERDYEKGQAQKKKAIDDEILGSFERAITRYIRPYDVVVPSSELINVSLFNLYRYGIDWTSDFKDQLVTLEIFSSGAQGEFRIAVDHGWVSLIKKKFPALLHPNTDEIIKSENTIALLFNIINQSTYRHLGKEIAFFEAYPQANGTEEIIHQLYSLREQTQNNSDSCILRMAFGSGFHAITGDWQYQDHRETGIWDQGRNQGKKKYKSRKIADDGYLYLMGFVRITLPEGAPRISVPKAASSAAQMEGQGETLTAFSSIAPGPKIEAKPVDFQTVGKESAFPAEVMALGKPFCRVRLLLTNYPFEGICDMSGTKKAQLKVGQIVKVLINSQNAEGEIKMVKFLH